MANVPYEERSAGLLGVSLYGDPAKNAKQRKYYADNRDAIRALRYTELLDPARRAAKNLRQREYYRKNRAAIIARAAAKKTPEFNRERARKAREAFGVKLGLSEDELKSVLTQNFCEICGASGERMAIDHCHASGRFRGVLCNMCNLGLGSFRDRPELLSLAAEYLRRTA